MRYLFHDFLLSLRTLWRKPWVAIATITTLALGIGASTAIFSVVDAILLQPLPFRDADRLVTLWETHPRQGAGYQVTSRGAAELWGRELEELADLALSY